MHALSRIPSLFDMDLFETGNHVTKRWMPAVNVRETEAHYIVEAEVPGIPPEMVDLSITGNMLMLRGEKQREVTKDDDHGKTHVIERSYGSFMRKIRLPHNVDPESAKAEAANGVLTITVAKRDLPKKIDIQVDLN